MEVNKDSFPDQPSAEAVAHKGNQKNIARDRAVNSGTEQSVHDSLSESAGEEKALDVHEKGSEKTVEPNRSLNKTQTQTIMNQVPPAPSSPLSTTPLAPPPTELHIPPQMAQADVNNKTKIGENQAPNNVQSGILQPPITKSNSNTAADTAASLSSCLLYTSPSPRD